MTIFTLTIDKVNDYAVGGLTGIVKDIEWTLTAEDQGFVVNAVTKTTLADPDTAKFVALENIAQDKLIAWVETSTQYAMIKEFLQTQLSQVISNQTLTSTQ